MDRKTDVTKFQPTIGTGRDVKDTSMLKGGDASLTAAQKDTNDTGPYEVSKGYSGQKGSKAP